MQPERRGDAGAAGTCRFAHLSDAHLTDLSGAAALELRGKRLLGYLSWRRRRRREHRREVLDILVAHLQGDAPQQILVSGDLTHIGLQREFREAASWLASLGPAQTVGVVPGNHELCRRRGADAGLALWSDYLRGDDGGNAGAAYFPSVRERAGVAFIGLSSAVATPALLATGRVGRTQREALARRLDETAQRGLFRVLYLHHCPVPGTDKWRKRLTDAPQLAGLLYEHGVELVLHGHGHRSIDGELATRHGTAPVLGVASASAAHGGEAAGYRSFDLEPRPDGWLLRARRFSYETASKSMTLAGGKDYRLLRAHAGGCRHGLRQGA